MNAKLRLPMITATTTEGKLVQFKSYLFQLTNELNQVLSDMESKADTAVSTARTASTASKDPQSTFNSVKALIIKSADIIDAYTEAINTTLSGYYVAQSEFGEYSERTEQYMEATDQNIESIFTNIQEIISEVEEIANTIIDVNAYIKSGLLDYDNDGVPIYGLEIGQETEIDGEKVFNQYARFTANKLSFFDNNGIEVAYISDRKLYITHVEVTGSFGVGYVDTNVGEGYRSFIGLVDTVRPDGSVVTKYIERRDEV